MNLTTIIHIDGINMEVDFMEGINCSFHLQNGSDNPNAFYLPHPQLSPFKHGDFIGSTLLGGPVNCSILQLAPHGNGTHTESIWHISKEEYPIAKVFDRWHFIGTLCSIECDEKQTNLITKQAIKDALGDSRPEALIIRTRKIPAKTQWSGLNAIAFEPEAMAWMADIGIMHFLTDLPSVDPEEDEGRLAAHHAFWHYPNAPRKKATITEMICIPEDLSDGTYLVQFGIAPLHSDASPSMITLYPLRMQKS